MFLSRYARTIGFAVRLPRNVVTIVVKHSHPLWLESMILLLPTPFVNCLLHFTKIKFYFKLFAYFNFLYYLCAQIRAL